MTQPRFVVTDSYKVAAGWNNAGSLALLSPMPRGVCQQVIAGSAIEGIDGTLVEDGFYIDIPYIALDRSELVTVLAQWGLSSASFARVTISVPRFDTYANYNAVAKRFITGQTGRRKLNYWGDIIIRCTRLQPI